jgi:hypothetical protein
MAAKRSTIGRQSVRQSSASALEAEAQSPETSMTGEHDTWKRVVVCITVLIHGFRHSIRLLDPDFVLFTEYDAWKRNPRLELLAAVLAEDHYLWRCVCTLRTFRMPASEAHHYTNRRFPPHSDRTSHRRDCRSSEREPNVINTNDLEEEKHAPHRVSADLGI